MGICHRLVVPAIDLRISFFFFLIIFSFPREIEKKHRFPLASNNKNGMLDTDALASAIIQLTTPMLRTLLMIVLSTHEKVDVAGTV